MRTVDNEAFQEDLGENFSEAVILHLDEEMQEERAEPERVGIRVT